MKKPSILVFVDWYLPAFKGGGIITSLASVIKNLEDDHVFKIFTRNRDFGSNKPLESVVSDTWIALSPKTQINYCSCKRFCFRTIVKEVNSQNYDVVYINSIFSFYFSILPLLLINLKRLKKYSVILAPMGMLSPGALIFKKHKKILFLFLAKYTGIYKNVTFHASSQMESDDIYRVFGKEAKVFIASYLFNPVHLPNTPKVKMEGSMKLVYISRISPKKNLMAAIEYLHQVNKNCKIEFSIIGTIEDKQYWNECKAKIATLPGNITCLYSGEMESNKIIPAFQQFHFSILPTYSENYGQVIPESFAGGTPVILSDRTPWQDLDERSAGWVIPFDDTSRFVKTIEDCANMNQENYDRLQNGAYQYAHELSNNPEMVARLKEMFAG